MILFPAVDIMGADAVKFSRRTGAAEIVYGPAVEMIRRWTGMGADWVHIVDLHGALSMPSNAENMAAAVRAAREAGAGIQIGGGLRSDEALEYYLGKLAVERVLIATRAIRDPEWLRRMAERWPNRIVLSLDAYGEKLALDGWKTTTDITTGDAIRQVSGLPLAGYMYTNLHVEGAGAGVDWGAIKKFVGIADRGTVISGGVTTLDEVRSLKELGVFGVILGSALYRGSIGLDRALELRG